MSSREPVRRATKKRKLEPKTIEQPESYSAVLESHLNLLNQGRLSDVTFIVGERKERTPCHQLFLRARSSVFEAMLSERWNQDTNREISLPDVQPKTFRMFLQFMYADIFAANVPEALELLQVANKYDVPLLASKCEEVLEGEVKLKDTIRLFRAARKYENIQLMDKIGAMWADFRSLSVLPTLPSFFQLDKETWMYILKRNDLEMREVELFRLVLIWASNRTDVIDRDKLQDVLPLIRFPTMTLNEFTTAVVPTNILSPPTVIELFTYFGTDDKLKESLAMKLGFSTQQRQPKNCIVYVKLYTKEIIAGGATTLQTFKTFKESLQFHSSVGCQQLGSQQRSLGFGLNNISFYCPVKATTTGASRRAVFKTFEIRVSAKDCRDRDLDFYSTKFYKELFSSPVFQIEQGTINNIVLDTVLPLNMDTIYCITVEGRIKRSIDGSLQGCHAIEFDTDPINNVDVNIENIPRTTLTVRRNQLQGFTQDSSGHASPHFICGLGFQAL